MGILNSFFSDDKPTFDLDEWYYNEDFEGNIRVVNREPFLIQYEGIPHETPVSRELYRNKLEEGTIYKKEDNL